jgi:hypothetical protein
MFRCSVLLGIVSIEEFVRRSLLTVHALATMSVYAIAKRDITDAAAIVRKESNMFPSLTFGPNDGPLKLLLVSVKRKVKGVVQKVELPVLVPLPEEGATTFPAWHPEYEPTEEEVKPTARGMKVRAERPFHVL